MLASAQPAVSPDENMQRQRSALDILADLYFCGPCVLMTPTAAADLRSSPAPHADPAELGKFDALAPRFWDPDGEFRPLHLLNPVRTSFIAERAALSGARVLDVGCGGGLLCEALARAGAQVTGIDLAPGMIEVARLHALSQNLKIEYRIEDAQ